MMKPRTRLVHLTSDQLLHQLHFKIIIALYDHITFKKYIRERTRIKMLTGYSSCLNYLSSIVWQHREEYFDTLMNFHNLETSFYLTLSMHYSTCLLILLSIYLTKLRLKKKLYF
jgi:hypothetical protein